MELTVQVRASHPLFVPPAVPDPPKLPCLRLLYSEVLATMPLATPLTSLFAPAAARTVYEAATLNSPCHGGLGNVPMLATLIPPGPGRVMDPARCGA